MGQDPTKLVTVAAVCRPEQGDPYCVVRWSLGASGSELPRLDDKFDVSLSVGGNVVAQRVVSPLGYAMLDPSRREAPDLYPTEKTPWWVAVKPTGPIDPSHADTEDLSGRAIGVAHILEPTAPARLRMRGARVLYAAFQLVRANVKAFSGISDIELTRSAVAFTEILLQTRTQPRHLPQLLAREYRDMQAKRGSPTLLAFERSGSAHLAHAALVLNAIAMPGVAQRLDEVIGQSMNVREHIRVAALQGGSMIDYWDDPANLGLPRSDSERGRLWPAAELIGCGCRMPIALSDLRAWATGADNLLVTVAHRQREYRLADIEQLAANGFKNTQDIWLDSDISSWASSTSEELTPSRLKLALSQARSSHPAQAPSGARVDWTMVRVDLDEVIDPATRKAVPTDTSLTFRTGDARVEIVIQRPKLPPLARRDTANADEERSGAAYNVYGVWEGAPGFDAYFNDPKADPDLAQLRPWLLTKRYNFAKDLKEAFPDVAGKTHPKLQEILESPPWHPHLKRPDLLRNETTADTTSLPDTGSPGDAIYTLDLRTGMNLPAHARPAKGWEVSAPAAVDWHPGLNRELQPVPHGRPQRYRFWVTAVDAFDQESRPCPVLTHDDDLQEEETTIFEPKRRSPLAAPPGGAALACHFVVKSSQLQIKFETPFERQISDQASTSPPKRVAASEIEARVILFRRILLERFSDAKVLSPDMSLLPDLPQWKALARDLARDRWVPWRALSVSPPTVGDAWTTSVQLEDGDLGWEYLAAVGMQVKTTSRAFWAKSIVEDGTSGRRCDIIISDASGVYPRPEDRPFLLVNETPADSPVSLFKPCMVSDGRSPLWPEVSAYRVAGALPVSAPPGIRRDIILQRLLERSFVDQGQPVPKVSWGDEELTVGQATLSEAALKRTWLNDQRLPEPTSEDLAATRRLLAKDFHKESSGKLRQHASIGFRGLACLEWTYTPRSKRTSATKMAEATVFRVYSVQAPLDPAAATNFATGIATLTRNAQGDGSFTGSFTKGDKETWEAITKRPTLVALGPVANPAWASVVFTSGTFGRCEIKLRPHGVSTLPAGPVEARFYVAQPLDDVASGGIDEISHHKFYAPIGGGGRSFFGWWVTGVSAAGLESPPGAISPMQGEVLSLTVEPPPVFDLVARPAVRAADVMNPTQSRKWMPKAIQTLNDAKHYPRTVISWRTPSEPDLNLEIRRIEEQISRGTGKAQDLAARTAWDAVLDIERLPDGAAITKQDLDLLGEWLSGTPIAVPEIASEYWPVFTNHDRFPVSGVVAIDESEVTAPLVGGADPKAGWIDYFGRNGDAVSAMDGNWQFRYQLAAYIDLGDTAGDQRWLYSSATTWSPFTVPDRPPIVLIAKAPKPKHTNAHKARVVFDLQAVSTRSTRLERPALDDVSWEYRVVIRRLLPSAGLSAREAPWIDVGSPATLRLDDPDRSHAEVIDNDVDRSWPGHVPELQYRVYVQEFMRIENSEAGYPTCERLVRAYETQGAKDIFIALKAPSSDADEIEMQQVIEIS